MKTFIDANVLLEVLLAGRKRAATATASLRRIDDGAVSPLTVHLYVYFGRKEGYTIDELLQDLQNFRTVTMDAAVVDWARKNMRDNDFEDALQVASAVLDGCERFITFDTKLAKQYGDVLDIKLLR